MSELEDMVTHYIAALSGPSAENAYHGLLEAGPAAVPFLATAFSTERRPEMRATILQIIWQSRNPSALPVLASGLADPAPAVWRAALDGLVTLRGPKAVETLRAARNRAVVGEGPVPIDWLEEALQQIDEASV